MQASDFKMQISSEDTKKHLAVHKSGKKNLSIKASFGVN